MGLDEVNKVAIEDDMRMEVQKEDREQIDRAEGSEDRKQNMDWID